MELCRPELALIDRIEVLKGGASTIYGADAMAGVVNIILRDNWPGPASRNGLACSLIRARRSF